MSRSVTNDNSDLASKLAIRAKCREWVGGPLRVLDCFAGHGKMRQLAWADAEAYLCMDVKPECAAPDVWIGDCLRLIPLAFAEGRTWNTIDLDAHGNPYLALYQVARYAPEGEYAIAFTDGMMRSMFGLNVPKFVRWVTKYPCDDGRFLVNWYDDFVRWALAKAKRMTIHECKRVQKSPQVKSVWYYGLRVSFSGPPTGSHRVDSA